MWYFDDEYDNMDIHWFQPECHFTYRTLFNVDVSHIIYLCFRLMLGRWLGFFPWCLVKTSVSWSSVAVLNVLIARKIASCLGCALILENLDSLYFKIAICKPGRSSCLLSPPLYELFLDMCNYASVCSFLIWKY